MKEKDKEEIEFNEMWNKFLIMLQRECNKTQLLTIYNLSCTGVLLAKLPTAP